MTNEFAPLSTTELADILGLTIKHDNVNKVVTFLCMLSAYTEDSQFNLSFNAPTSAGKSYIATEVSKLFPKEDLRQTGHNSPTAFLYQKAQQVGDDFHLDLARKIIIFLDQRDTQVLQRLRPILSHDQKEIRYSITNHDQKLGFRTKNIVIHGYPAVINCTATQNIDAQESSRFLLLSPEMNQEKIHAGIDQTIKNEADPEKFRKWLEAEPRRQVLKQRIAAIKAVHNEMITIPGEQMIRNRFFKENPKLLPRHQRDIKWLLAIIKTLALLNCWWRGTDPNRIAASDEDINSAWDLWQDFAESQNRNLSPFLLQLYKDVIKPLFQPSSEYLSDDQLGITRQAIIAKHYEVYGRSLDYKHLSQEVLPMLERAGLIRQEKSIDDRRVWLVLPPLGSTIVGPKNSTPDQGTDVPGIL